MSASPRTLPPVEHDLHRRRASRNVGLGLVLVALIAIVFAMTVVKVRLGEGAALKGYDHTMGSLPAAQPKVAP